MTARKVVHMAVVALATILFSSLESRAQTEPSPGKLAAIREFFEVSQAMSMAATIVDSLSGQIMNQFRQKVPGLRQDHADELATLLSSEFRANTESLERMMVLLYDRHFTEEELKAATAFYRTPAGKSMLAKTPLVFQEGFTLGQRWGADVGRRAAERALERGRALGYSL
jgi:hypothetical protein